MTVKLKCQRLLTTASFPSSTPTSAREVIFNARRAYIRLKECINLQQCKKFAANLCVGENLIYKHRSWLSYGAALHYGETSQQVPRWTHEAGISQSTNQYLKRLFYLK